MPARAARNLSSACTTCKSVLKWFVNSSITDSASSSRNRPLSTRMHENCGPMARYQQRRHDRRIDPAGQAADHAALAHLLAESLDRLARRSRRSATCRCSGRCLEKVAQDLAAPGRVRDLGMKLQAVDRQPAMLDRGDGAGVGRGQRLKSAETLRHLVAVAHPDLGLVGHAGEQLVVDCDLAHGPGHTRGPARFRRGRPGPRRPTACRSRCPAPACPGRKSADRTCGAPAS